MCASLKGADTLVLDDQGFVSLPEEFTVMSSLTKLSLSRNVLSALPASISDLSSLSVFCVRNNRIILVPPELSLCVNIIELDLGQNLIARIPQELCSLKRMRKVSLDGNRLIFVPAAIYGWHQMEIVNLSKQRTLSSLSLILDALQEEQLPPLRRGLVVKLPPSSFKQVHTFEAASCDIDDVHIWLHNVASLQCLIMPDNKLKQIPTTLDMWPLLKTIDVRHNLVHSLPTAIGNCTNMVNLLLDDNKLSQLPSGLTNLNALSQLGLSYNLLSEVPFSFRRFTNLTTLRLANNPFRALPAGLGVLTKVECDVPCVW
jgi:Leucine-rich repeat (LRR) protein